MNVLTMTLDEIYALEHVTVTEDDYHVYVTPETGYCLRVADYPEDEIVYDTLKMLKQPKYSDITVRSALDPSCPLDYLDYDGSLNFNLTDSLTDTSVNFNSSILNYIDASANLNFVL